MPVFTLLEVLLLFCVVIGLLRILQGKGRTITTKERIALLEREIIMLKHTVVVLSKKSDAFQELLPLSGSILEEIRLLEEQIKK